MTLIGMLHHRADPRKVNRAYAFSVVAKAEGVDFFYFTPGNVDIEENRIKGKYYHNGEWHEKLYPFPDVIYNASPPFSEKAQDIIDYLYDRIPFTSHSVGDKFSVQKRIERGGKYSCHLIPTKDLDNENTLFEMLDLYHNVVVKPIVGHQGKGIFLIEMKDRETFLVNEGGNLQTYSREQLSYLVESRMNENIYLVQKFITCLTKAGNVFDFRLHVQKNGKGEWVVTTIFPRIGPLECITSNLGSGGSTAYLDDFLQKEFEDEWFNIKQTLEYFSINFSKHFESLYHDVLFDELGIDVGIDEDHKIWLFEVNWRPGAPIIFNFELDLVRNFIHYAKYLSEIK